MENYMTYCFRAAQDAGRIAVANVYGNKITRIRPKKRTSQPTAKQLLIQERMKRCASFMQAYRGYACKYYGSRTGMKSPYNLAMANLMENFKINYADSTITPDYSAISFSKGNLLASIPLNLNLASAESLEISWQDNSAGNVERENDLAQTLISAETENQSYFVENAAERSDEPYTAHLPVNFRNKTLHVWLTFRSSDQELVSNSQYAGSIS